LPIAFQLVLVGAVGVLGEDGLRRVPAEPNVKYQWLLGFDRVLEVATALNLEMDHRHLVLVLQQARAHEGSAAQLVLRECTRHTSKHQGDVLANVDCVFRQLQGILLSSFETGELEDLGVVLGERLLRVPG